MIEMQKKDTLELLNNIKRECESKMEKAYDSFCIFPNDHDRLEVDSYSAYAAALETAIRCVEAEGEG